MPVQKYLEIDSTYRNRNLYPSPGSFNVNISQAGGKTQLNATDPVSNAYTDIIFKIFDPNNVVFKLVVASGDPSEPFPEIATSSKTTLVMIINFILIDFRTLLYKQPNFFSGFVLSSKQTDNYILRRILKSTFLNEKVLLNSSDFYFLFEIDQPIPDTLIQNTTTFTLFNPTTLNSGDMSYVFLPRSVPVDNFYENYVIYNRTKKNYSSIVSFNGTTHLAEILYDTNFNWQSDDILEVKKEPPNLTGQLSVGLANFSNSVNLGAGVIAGPNFINSFLEVYLIPTQLEIYNIFKITNIIGTYKDKTGATIYTTNLQEMTSYTSYVIVDNLTIDVSSDNFLYELLQYSYDNTNGFNYTGSMVSVTQPSAYELTLNSICLPNIQIMGGGKIWNYPFFYVEIENVSSSSSNSNNIIYSNNPNCLKAVFKVPVMNITNPDEYQFLTYNGNGVKQTITIKPNSDMKLTVRLPNGKVFSPFEGDTSYGQAPNTQKQLSVLISFEKI